MKHPMAGAAILYASGILLGHALPIPLLWLFVAALALAALAIFVDRWRTSALVPLWVLAGCTNITWQTAPLSPVDLRRVLGEEPVLATVRGTLRQTPWQRILKSDRGESVRSLGLIDAHAMLRNGAWEPVSGCVITRTYGELDPAFFDGREVEITGTLQPPPGPAAECLFDYRSHLKWQGIYFQLLSDNTNDWTLVGAPCERPPLSDRFRTWSQAALAKGLPIEDEPLRLLWAMTLGWKTGLEGQVAEPFMLTGTMHIFAVSGLHIALIAGILVSCLSVLRVPRTLCGGVVVPIIWFYTLVTGWQPSAIRSTVMMSVVIIGWSLRRPSNLLNSLAAAGTILLLWDPRQLFQPSFQLSFFVVLGMGLLTPRLEEFFRPTASGDTLISTEVTTWKGRWLRALVRLGLHPDPLVPQERIPRMTRFKQMLFKVVSTSFTTSLAAWLASLPLIVWYFNLITPVSLIANLVIVPVSTLALMSNLGSILTAWAEPVGVLFNHSGWFWMWAMQKLCVWMADWPLAAIYLPKPTIVACILFYITVFGAFAGWLRSDGKWQSKRCMALGLAWMLALGHIWFSQPLAKITVLSLRAGDAIFIDEPGRSRDLLIDGGDARASEFLTRSFLHAQGVNRLSNLLLTHGDVQHCGAASNLIASFRVREVAASTAKFRSKPYRDLLDHAAAINVPLNKLTIGSKIGRWTVLHPERDSGTSLADDQVLVLKGEIGGIKVLFCSDLGRQGQRKLLERGADLHADILIASMPAARDGLSSGLVQAVAPRAVVLTAGSRPPKKTVQAETRSEFESQNIFVSDTAESGSVTLLMERGRVAVRTINGLNRIITR